jgi:hypothetical protein
MIALWRGKIEKGWIGIHEINGVIHGQTEFGIKNSYRSSATALESLLALLTSLLNSQWHQKACWYTNHR